MIALVVLGLLICGASAWVINDAQGRVSGTVEFYNDGHGILNASGYPNIFFDWKQQGELIVANYLFYSLPVYYNSTSDVLYSPSVSNVTLVRG